MFRLFCRQAQNLLGKRKQKGHLERNIYKQEHRKNCECCPGHYLIVIIITPQSHHSSFAICESTLPLCHKIALNLDLNRCLCSHCSYSCHCSNCSNCSHCNHCSHCSHCSPFSQCAHCFQMLVGSKEPTDRETDNVSYWAKQCGCFIK